MYNRETGDVTSAIQDRHLVARDFR